MKQTTRTFLAVEIDQTVRSKVSKAVARLRSRIDTVKWVEAENLHITMKFLGEIPTTDLYEVVRAAEEAIGPLEPFEIEVAGIGAFPNLSSPRTIWLGIDDGASELVRLAEQLDTALEKCGYPREGRAFRPHLTLGRARRGRAPSGDLPKLLAEYEDVGFGRTSVDAVTVFSSELSRFGPKYEAVGHAWL